MSRRTRRPGSPLRHGLSPPVKVCRCPSECASMSCRLPIGRAARAPSSRGRGAPVANKLPAAPKRSSRRECAAGACAPVRARYSKSVGVAAVRRKHHSCAVQSRHAIVTERKKLLREQRRWSCSSDVEPQCPSAAMSSNQRLPERLPSFNRHTFLAQRNDLRARDFEFVREQRDRLLYGVNFGLFSF